MRSLVPRRCVYGAAAGALVAGILAGCTTARISLGTSDSACYLALPTATKAVLSNGKLVGVRRITLSGLRKQAPRLLGDLATKVAGSQAVCVIAFEGTYTTQTVMDPRGAASGRVAVVVSTTPGNHVLGTVIFEKPPLHFGHSHVG